MSTLYKVNGCFLTEYKQVGYLLFRLRNYTSYNIIDTFNNRGASSYITEYCARREE